MHSLTICTESYMFDVETSKQGTKCAKLAAATGNKVE